MLKVESDLQSLHLPLQVDIEQAELRYVFDAIQLIYLCRQQPLLSGICVSGITA